MRDILRQIMQVMQKLDEEDLGKFDIDDLDVDINSDIENIKTGSSTRSGFSSRKGDPKRRKSSKHDKSGAEKFRAKRKVKKLNRLLKKAEKQGFDIGQGLQEEPMVRKYDRSDEVVIVADRSDADIVIEHGEATVSFERVGATESFNIELDNPCVETKENQGVTRFFITEE
jgi:hypothetical protein